MKIPGYGKVALINLSNNTIKIWETEDLLIKYFIGGRGLNIVRLYKLISSDTEPFSERNPIILGSGPLSVSIFGGRVEVTSLSPLTNILSTGSAGGYFGPVLKMAGYDQVIIIGKSQSPIYVYIHDEKIEILDAKDIWGLDTWETIKSLRKDLGSNLEAMTIGPAGENLVKISNIVTEYGRSVGRGGLGSVMGWKNLKAIAAVGSSDVTLYDYEKYLNIVDEIIEHVKRTPQYDYMQKFGYWAAAGVKECQELGCIPGYNFTSPLIPFAEEISTEKFVSEYVSKKLACYGCYTPCDGYFHIKAENFFGLGIKLEGLLGLGARLGISDLTQILKANILCNKYGLDIISVAGVLSYVMECNQRGYRIKGAEDIVFGNSDAVLEAIKNIAFRENIGKLLAEGVKHLSENVGGSTKDFAMHVKGLEITSIEPRSLKGWGLAYAVSTRGGCHTRAFPMIEIYGFKDLAKLFFGNDAVIERLGVKGKGKMIKWLEDYSAAIDSLGICKFPPMDSHVILPAHLVKLYEGFTGLKLKQKDLLTSGERVVNLERIMIYRRGIRREHDTLPKRLIKEEIKEGPAKGHIIELDVMLDEYYEERRWNHDGFPSDDKIKELKLELFLY